MSQSWLGKNISQHKFWSWFKHWVTEQLWNRVLGSMSPHGKGHPVWGTCSKQSWPLIHRGNVSYSTEQRREVHRCHLPVVPWNPILIPCSLTNTDLTWITQNLLSFLCPVKKGASTRGPQVCQQGPRCFATASVAHSALLFLVSYPGTGIFHRNWIKHILQKVFLISYHKLQEVMTPPSPLLSYSHIQ